MNFQYWLVHIWCCPTPATTIVSSGVLSRNDGISSYGNITTISESRLDPAVLSEIMKQSSGGNWSLNVYNPYPGVMDGVPASRGYSGGFLVDLMTKDLDLALDTAAQSRSSVPLGSLAKNLYRLHQSSNDAGGLDFSSIQWLYQPDLKE